jgi:membrane-bound ClpP family serine protease
MGFLKELFKDDNTINEKSVVGFGSFIMMVITLAVDLATGVMGKEMPIHEFVFDGFLVITLGSFGIASVDKYINNKHNKEEKKEEMEG